MCKLIMIPDVPEDKIQQTWKFIFGAKYEMSAVDKHGMGYMAYYSDTDTIAGERWLYNKEAFIKRDEDVPENIKKYQEHFQSAVKIDKKYNGFGIFGKVLKSIGVHSRFATCAVNIENTHPFWDRENQTALIHNGVISNHHEFDKKISSCDSEAILSSYVENKVNENPDKMDDLISEVNGSMACGLITKHNNKTYFDIWRNSASTLCTSFVDKIGTFVIATTPAIIKRGAKAIQSKHDTIYDINPNYYMRFDIATGKLIKVKEIKHYVPAKTFVDHTKQSHWWKEEKAFKDSVVY